MSKRPAKKGEAAGQPFRLLVEAVRDYAIFMLDPQGRVVTWNIGAELINGYRADEIIGQHFSRFYPAEAVARDHPAYELKVAAETGHFEEEGWRVRKDGTRFWANVVITALRDADGKLVGFGKVTRDLTQRRAHEEALKASEERFRLLVERVTEYAVFMLDVNGYVATWNSGAERIKGYSAAEIIGRHFRAFYPKDVADSGYPEYELKTAASAGMYVDEGWRIRKDGSRFWAHVTITALRDDEGRLRGFAKLTRDMTEQKRTEALESAGAEREALLEAERTARIEAQRATRIKDEFLASLSHELRTPLNAILGWAQVLRTKGERARTPDELDRAMEIIERNARAQVRLIDDLLDLSRIMGGRMRLDVQEVGLVDVVQSAIDSMEPAARAKGVRLEGILDPQGAVVSGDAARLQQVFWNLLSNAVKFTPKGGRIQVILQRANSHLEVSVADTGIGIAADYLPHVFDRFSQADTSLHRKHGGLGLGLAISKQLVDLHGGSIHAKSMGEGKGATFIVHLPLAITRSAAHAARMHESRGESAESLAVPRLDGIRALVIDDEPDARELIKRVLEDHGANVRAAQSAAEALDMLQHDSADVVVSDVGMPDMDGYQFMRRLRAFEAKGSRIPALAVTALARPDDRKQAILAGYQAHLAKPFDMAEFVIVVAGLAGRT
ncbi:MAG TPA: PAS domain S-box protein [Burkholderiales bacterium]|nr:PAS domain S-box protein [Burkholderiales bacterium]